MTSLVQRVGRLAVETFRRDTRINGGVKKKRLTELEVLMANISSSDLSIDPALLSGQARDGRAPVTYVLLYEDCDVQVCVFILRNGVKMPMHDHPGMTGLLKVVHGNILVKSYSLTGPTSQSGIQSAVKHDPVPISSTSQPISLTPDKENLHEIWSVDGPAAFLDILSPPYGVDNIEHCERDCHYYQEVDPWKFGISNSSSNITYLQQIPAPRNFWCDQAEYKGPPLMGIIRTK